MRVAVVILTILCLVLGIKIILDLRQKEKLESEYRTQEIEIVSAYQQLDSVQNELQRQITQIDELGGQIDTLLKVQEVLKNEKKALRWRSRTEIHELKERIKGYTSLLLAKDEEIERLQATNESLLTENTGLKREQKVLQASISTLNKEKETLEEKIEQAARLEVGNISVLAKNVRGKNTALRAQRIKSLVINFDILENEIASIDNKEIFIRILDPYAEPLFDIHQGGGSFFLGKKELFYTLKQDIIYKKSRQSLSFLYEKQSPYLPGTYILEIYAEGYLIGKENFNLR